MQLGNYKAENFITARFKLIFQLFDAALRSESLQQSLNVNFNVGLLVRIAMLLSLDVLQGRVELVFFRIGRHLFRKARFHTHQTVLFPIDTLTGHLALLLPVEFKVDVFSHRGYRESFVDKSYNFSVNVLVCNALQVRISVEVFGDNFVCNFSERFNFEGRESFSFVFLGF